LCTHVDISGLPPPPFEDPDGGGGWHTLVAGQSAVTLVAESTPQGPFGKLTTCANPAKAGVHAVAAATVSSLARRISVA
jgi:hypothetical protein